MHAHAEAQEPRDGASPRSPQPAPSPSHARWPRQPCAVPRSARAWAARGRKAGGGSQGLRRSPCPNLTWPLRLRCRRGRRRFTRVKMAAPGGARGGRKGRARAPAPQAQPPGRGVLTKAFLAGSRCGEPGLGARGQGGPRGQSPRRGLAWGGAPASSAEPSPGTAGASEPVGGRRPGARPVPGELRPASRYRDPAAPSALGPRHAPAGLAVLGLLLLLLPTGEATKKPTPCRRCRELVDKFNQVGRSLRGDGGGRRGRPAMAQELPHRGPAITLPWTGSPHHGLGHPPWTGSLYHGLGHPPCGSPHHGLVHPMD